MFSPGLHRQIAFGSVLLGVAFMPYSIRVCHFGFLVFVLNWLLEGRWNEKKQCLHQNPVVLLFSLFFLMHLAGITYASDLSNGWTNVEKKAFLFIVPIALATTPSFSPILLRKVFLTFILACFLATLYCLLSSVISANHSSDAPNFSGETLSIYHLLNPNSSVEWMHFSYIGLSSGIDLHPTYFGLYLLFCLLLVFHLFRETQDFISSRVKYIYVFLFIYFSFFLVLLSSRIITLCALAIIVNVAFRFLSRGASVTTLAVGLFFITGIFSFIYVNPVSRYRNLQEIFITEIAAPEVLAKNSINIRTSLWWLSKKAVSEMNPWFGVGTGGVDDTLRKLSDRFNVKNILNTYDPHNQFIHTFLGLGGFGLLFLVLLFFIPLVLAHRRKDYLFASFTGIFVLICLTESAMEVQKGIIFFSFFSSLLFFHRKGLGVTQSSIAYA